MNAERLLAEYEQIADVPDAIARLRRFVLNLAVRGKLVPQDPSDEPASKLSARLKQEWAKLLKSGLAREPTSLVLIERQDLPFHPPEHWEWARLIEVALSERPTLLLFCMLQPRAIAQKEAVASMRSKR